MLITIPHSGEQGVDQQIPSADTRRHPSAEQREHRLGCAYPGNILLASGADDRRSIGVLRGGNGFERLFELARATDPEKRRKSVLGSEALGFQFQLAKMPRTDPVSHGSRPLTPVLRFAPSADRHTHREFDLSRRGGILKQTGF